MATKKLQILDSLIKQVENADTLDGKHADEFASASDVAALKIQVGDTSVSEQIDVAVDDLVPYTIPLRAVMSEDEEFPSFIFVPNYTFNPLEINEALEKLRPVKCLVYSDMDDSTPVGTFPLSAFQRSNGYYIFSKMVQMAVEEICITSDGRIEYFFYDVYPEPSLTIPNKAADSKAVGDALATKADKSAVEAAIAQKSQVQIITWEEND